MSEVRQYTTEEVIPLIIQWHHDRNLIEGSTDEAQCLKLLSEVGEVADNVAKGRSPIDDIGDCMVVLLNIMERNQLSLQGIVDAREYDYGGDTEEYLVFSLARDIGQWGVSEMFIDLEDLCSIYDQLVVLATLHNLTLDQCLSHAYNDIKDRKGKMVNGVFVKDIQ